MHTILLVLMTGIICGDCYVQFFKPIPTPNTKSNRSITVMASVAEPFVIYDRKTSTLKGLDVDIINSFAKKHNLLVKFVLTDEKVNEVFMDGAEITTEDQQRQRTFLNSISKL